MATNKRTKTVYFYTCEAKGNLSLREAFLTREFHIPYKLGDKTLELKYPEQSSSGLITGSFVMTRTSGIPPKHRINTDDYDAIDLGEGEGLSYPNVFLFDPVNNVIAIEFNMNGAYPSQIAEFLRQSVLNRNHSLKEGVEPFDFSLNIYDLLSLDAYTRILNMDYFQKVTLKIAYPNKLAQKEINVNGPLELVGNLAEQLNATSSMEITFSSNLEDGVPGLNKNMIMGFVKNFNLIFQQLPPKRGRNKLVVEGLKNNLDSPENAEREIIDLTMDKMKGTFDFQEPAILNTIQHNDRKRGVLKCYDSKKVEIDKIFPINE